MFELTQMASKETTKPRVTSKLVTGIHFRLYLRIPPFSRKRHTDFTMDLLKFLTTV